jgi:nitrogen fixation/metabolism regulation signal transduction histidine kinase
MRLLRFERKIIAAITVVAVVSLAASFALGYVALRDSFAVGVNSEVQDELERSLELYRTHISTLREQAQRTADAIAGDHDFREALTLGDRAGIEAVLARLLDRYEDVSRILVRTPEGEPVAEAHRAEPEHTRPLTLEREIEPGARVVEVTVHAPLEIFEAHERAGDTAEVYRRLEEGADYVSGTFLAVYLALLFLVIGGALAVGVVVSRRVTRRIGDLADATAEVGRGDLSVQLPVTGRDEVAELTTAFNAMVRDLHESRGRIDYLSRISAWQEFARRLAHEIKNPLTPIQLAAQEMKRSYTGTDEKYRRSVDDAAAIIEEEVATLRRLVGEFSAFAKLPRAELARADLRDFARDLGPALQGVAEDVAGPGAAERVVVELTDDEVPVEIDAMMLKRCIDNLVRNAFQAIEEHGPKDGRVTVRVERKGGFAVLEVEDEGPGLTEEQAFRVFDPYFTTKSEGTGLGLAIVKKVVLEHHGAIEVDAADSGGALFRIRLPLAD